MSVLHAVGLPNVGVFGSVPALVELAVLAEHSGWDGVHLWDHLLYHDPEWPVASPVATAAAVAAATQRVRIVLTLTLPRVRYRMSRRTPPGSPRWPAAA